MTKPMQRRGLQGSRRRAGVALAVLAVALMTVAAPSAARQAIVKFKTPTFPTGVVSAYGSIWVSTHRDVFLYRINPKTNRIVARINLRADTCWLGASGGRVWASGCEGDNTTRVIDPRKSKVVGRLRGFGAVVGGGSLWVVRDPTSGVLVRLDPKTHVLLKSFRVGGSADVPTILAGYAYGSVWIGGPDTVRRIDGGTNTLTVIPLPGAKTKPSPNQGYAGGGPIAFAGSKAWIGNPAGIYELDPRRNKARLRRIRVGNLDQWGNIEMTSGVGSVWARTSGTQATRINPATGKVVARYPAAGGGGGVAAGYGSLWVTNAGLDSVWREPVKARRGPTTPSKFTTYHAKIFKPAFTVRLPAGWTVAERDAAGAQIWRKCGKCAHDGEENGEITLDMSIAGMSPSDAIARLQKAHNIDAGPSRTAQLGTLSGFEFTATRTGKGDVLFEDSGYGSEAVGAPLKRLRLHGRGTNRHHPHRSTHEPRWRSPRLQQVRACDREDDPLHTLTAASAGTVDHQIARRQRAREARPARPRPGSRVRLRERPRPPRRRVLCGK